MHRKMIKYQTSDSNTKQVHRYLRVKTLITSEKKIVQNIMVDHNDCKHLNP